MNTPQPTYCEHKSPAPPHQPPKPPELNEFEAKAVAQQQAMWDYVQQATITTDNFCTTPESSSGATEDHDM